MKGERKEKEEKKLSTSLHHHKTSSFFSFSLLFFPRTRARGTVSCSRGHKKRGRKLVPLTRAREREGGIRSHCTAKLFCIPFFLSSAKSNGPGRQAPVSLVHRHALRRWAGVCDDRFDSAKGKTCRSMTGKRKTSSPLSLPLFASSFCFDVGGGGGATTATSCTSPHGDLCSRRCRSQTLHSIARRGPRGLVITERGKEKEGGKKTIAVGEAFFSPNWGAPASSRRR